MWQLRRSLLIAIAASIGAAVPAVLAEPALVHVTGNMILTSSSTLIMEFAGPARGTQYDAIDVDGTIVIRGAITLEQLGGYIPGFLVPHHIIHAGSRDGVFRSVNGVVISPTRSLAVTYAGDDVFVTAAMPGDADVNGQVNFDDLLILAQNYANPATQIWQTGDFDGDATTDFDDLLQMAQNYASPGLVEAAHVASQFTPMITPEPTTTTLLIVVSPAVRRRCRPLTRRDGRIRR